MSAFVIHTETKFQLDPTMRIFPINRQEKANAGNVTQNIHPPLKQSTLIHTQTHTYRQSYINLLKIYVRHILNKGEDKGIAF